MIKDLSLKVQVKFVKAFCNTTDAAASSASARFMRLMLCC